MSNPMFKNLDNQRVDALDENSCVTLSGTINKTTILFLIMGVVALYIWDLCSKGYGDKTSMLLTISSISGLVLALITSFKPDVSGITAPIYAVCEGVLVGGVSYMFNSYQNGIVVNAVCLTILSALVMFGLFKSKLVQLTSKLRTIILTSTIAVAIFYLVVMVASFFGIHTNYFGTPLGIGLSLLFCAIAVFNYLIDFDMIERSVENGFPKYFEWYNGFGLMVTTVWLYFEILKLLAQLNRRN